MIKKCGIGISSFVAMDCLDSHYTFVDRSVLHGFLTGKFYYTSVTTGTGIWYLCCILAVNVTTLFISPLFVG